jgi:4-hydroxy-2-oxoheptanedioate aldolase
VTIEWHPNMFKERLRDGQVQLGLWAGLASAYTAEVIAGAGYDWVLIDTEHSPADLENVLGQLQAIEPYPTTAAVRVSWNDTVTIKRYLDIGAQTLLVPYVQTADEARMAVANTRYPPEGVRGVALTTRANRFGRLAEYTSRAAENICVIVQIETALGLENVEDIASVKGVDALFVGPADLHAALGYGGETTNPQVVSLIDQAITRIADTGKAPGVFAPIEDYARRWIDMGALVVAVGSDIGVLARGTENLLRRFREQPGE